MTAKDFLSDEDAKFLIRSVEEEPSPVITKEYVLDYLQHQIGYYKTEASAMHERAIAYEDAYFMVSRIEEIEKGTHES